MDPVPDGGVGYSMRDPALPEICGFAALLQIGIHRFREPETRFHIKDYTLFPMQPKDYTYHVPLYGKVNTMPLARSPLWNGDKREDLRAVTFELNKCIHWYLLDEKAPKTVEKAKKFFIDFFLPGLPSLKALYKGSCFVDTIKGWERMINDGLEGRASYPIAPHLLDPREKQLVDEAMLYRINEAVRVAAASPAVTTEYKRESKAENRILSETIPLHDQLLVKYRKFKLLPPHKPPPAPPPDEGSVLIPPTVVFYRPGGQPSI